ncbi:divergent polysaccharide deacetylase family protein [Mesobacterium sp. TK19101]|uniref:Divergent polysaccharide deacetylase family protein n=1 Tax=Mesobacterium hydrothermale TaxID=3111907 RepID=A0ABU6HK02_9RHOB|nr:divergent polysaccharide deacetylase family protein [Mesobacterium sp. TK19101]MEC3862180.1 divergent polysaccharide deacetylase family protein [Mesobacterium sp. TK19101]
MAKSVLAGLLGGTAVAALIAMGVSLAVGVPERLRPPVPLANPPVTETARIATPDVADGAAPATTPGTDAPVTEAPLPGMAAPGAGTDSALAGDVTRPGAVPRVGTDVAKPEAGTSAEGGPATTATGESPVTLARSGGSPAAPTAEAGPSLSTDPARMPVTAPAPEAPRSAEQVAALPTMPGSSAEPAVPGARPTPGARPQSPDTTPETLPQAAPAPLPDAPEAGDAPAAPAVAAAPDAPAVSQRPATPANPASPGGTAPDATPVPDATPAEPPQAAQPARPFIRRPASDTDDPGPKIGAPAGSLLDRDAVPTNRLRRDEGAAPQADDDLPPLRRFAIPVNVDPEQPRMAIVLIHDGIGPMTPDALSAFPLPLTIAVDTALPNATALAEEYRSLGFEVMALVDVPGTTQPFDAQAAVQGALAQVPAAIAVMEGVGDGLQGSRALSGRVAQLMLQTGHGLVMLPNGLNTAQSLARREGVPSVTVFRDFDGDGQTPRVMRRFLDQAAFRARQVGAVVMLGRMRPDTVSSLLLWGLQDRATALELVPVSNVLLMPPDGT